MLSMHETNDHISTDINVWWRKSTFALVSCCILRINPRSSTSAPAIVRYSRYHSIAQNLELEFTSALCRSRGLLASLVRLTISSIMVEKGTKVLCRGPPLAKETCRTCNGWAQSEIVCYHWSNFSNVSPLREKVVGFPPLITAGLVCWHDGASESILPRKRGLSVLVRP